MKIVENNDFLDDEPYLTIEICCKEMKETIFKDNNFQFTGYDFRLKGISIMHCPFCGSRIEYIQYGA